MKISKSIFIYGFLMAAVIAVLKAVEYRYMIRRIDVDIYIGLVALIFTALGIWVGIQVINKRSGSSNQKAADSQKIIDSLDLSEREMEVLLLMADGLSNQEIADRLFISIHTVKTHSSNLFSKLHVKRRTQAIQKSKEIGLIAT